MASSPTPQADKNSGRDWWIFIRVPGLIAALFALGLLVEILDYSASIIFGFLLIFILPSAVVAVVVALAIKFIATRFVPDLREKPKVFLVIGTLVFAPLVSLPLTADKHMLILLVDFFDSGEWVQTVPDKYVGRWIETEDSLNDPDIFHTHFDITQTTITFTRLWVSEEPRVSVYTFDAVKVSDSHVELYCDHPLMGETTFEIWPYKSSDEALVKEIIPGIPGTKWPDPSENLIGNFRR